MWMPPQNVWTRVFLSACKKHMRRINFLLFLTFLFSFYHLHVLSCSSRSLELSAAGEPLSVSPLLRNSGSIHHRPDVLPTTTTCIRLTDERAVHLRVVTVNVRGHMVKFSHMFEPQSDPDSDDSW